MDRDQGITDLPAMGRLAPCVPNERSRRRPEPISPVTQRIVCKTKTTNRRKGLHRSKEVAYEKREQGNRVGWGEHPKWPLPNDGLRTKKNA